MTPEPSPAARNPGPDWGFQFLRVCDRIFPEILFKPARAIGTGVAVALMPEQRRHSRAYLSTVLGRPATLLHVFRHFFAFEESLMHKLRVANGREHRTVVAPGSIHFKEYLRSGSHAFLGTFHFGRSDLLGFLLGPREQHRVFMVRHRVANSHDTEKLGTLFGKWLTFIWVNEPENLLFALKDAIAQGGSVAMKCDRLEFTSKTEAFDFLGASRLFPFTIYHLGLIFNLPVLLSVGTPGEEPSVSVLHSSPIWRPDPALSRTENLSQAHRHFQGFLRQLENLLRNDPYLWFNFTELNPIAPPESAASPASPRRTVPTAS